MKEKKTIVVEVADNLSRVAGCVDSKVVMKNASSRYISGHVTPHTLVVAQPNRDIYRSALNALKNKTASNTGTRNI